MTPAEIRAWLKRRGLTHVEAAKLLAMSVDGLRKNIYGHAPIGAQTERIIELTAELSELRGEKPMTKQEQNTTKTSTKIAIVFSILNNCRIDEQTSQAAINRLAKRIVEEIAAKEK